MKEQPDILANASGVVVSCFEWVQNNESFMWDEDYINMNLEKIMNKAFKEVWELHETKWVSINCPRSTTNMGNNCAIGCAIGHCRFINDKII